MFYEGVWRNLQSSTLESGWKRPGLTLTPLRKTVIQFLLTISPLITHYSHENRRNGHQLKWLLIYKRSFRQRIRKWRKFWRICWKKWSRNRVTVCCWRRHLHSDSLHPGEEWMTMEWGEGRVITPNSPPVHKVVVIFTCSSCHWNLSELGQGESSGSLDGSTLRLSL